MGREKNAWLTFTTASCEAALPWVALQSAAGRLEIGAARQNGAELRLWVTDNGVGLPPGFDPSRDAGTGLRNTRSRIERLYGSAAALVVRPNAPAGTIVELILPAAGAA